MATYIPNATQTTEPVESRTVESAALEFRTLKTSINARIDDVQDGLDTEIVNRIAGDANLQTQNNAQDVRLTAIENALLFIGEGGLPSTVYVQRFSGTGVQTAFTLNTVPQSENVVDIYINGIYQNKDTFSVAGAVIIFSEAPPAGADNIEVLVTVAIALGETDASLVRFLQAGTGAIVRTAQDKMREWVSVKDFGAVGDGVTDDGASFKKALDAAVAIGMPLCVEGTFLLNTWTKYVPAGALELRGSGVIKTAGATSFTTVGGDTTIDGLIFDGWTRVVDVAEEVDIGRFQFSNNIVQNGKEGILWASVGANQIGYGEAQVFNNTFRNMQTDGVYLRPRRMEVTKVTNNTFMDFLSTTTTINGVVVGLSTATGLKRHMAEISGNTFFNLKLSSDAPAANIYPILVHEVENYVVSGNNIKNIWKEGLAYATEIRGIHTRAGRGVVIGNTIENVRGTAINIVDSINDAGIDHITQIVNNTISSDDGSAFIGIKVRCQDSTVKGNLIENANIAIQGTHPQYSGAFRTQVYSDNTIRNAHLAGIRVALNRRGLQISNNNISTVDNVINAAIDPDDFTEVTTAIHIVGTTGGNTQNITLTGNLIQNVTGSALTFENAAGETISGIVATGNMFVSVTSSLFNVVGAVIKALMFKGNSVSVSGSIAPALDSTNVLHLEGNEYRTISASQNDFSTAGENIYVTVSGASSRGITGFANGFSGRRITVFNAGTANNLLLSHESTSSSTENRISSGTGADVTLGLGDCATLVYDATASRWRIVSAFS